MGYRNGHTIPEVQTHAMSSAQSTGNLRRYLAETTRSDGNVSFRMVRVDATTGQLFLVGDYIMTPADFATLKLLNPTLAQAPVGVAGN